jgi:uracil-DNA glycosylase
MMDNHEQGRRIKLDQSWLSRISTEFEKPYMDELRAFLVSEKKAGKEIYPSGDDIFSALNHTPFDEIKVVIIGQDPYHGPNQAHGLCFSVLPGVPIPPSLINIYKEMSTDLGIPPVHHGCLLPWAENGVLLLNSVLTVEKNRAASHRNRGWESFTDKIVRVIDRDHSGAAFILWGAYAQKKGAFIDRNRHLVLSAPHPSPLSASRGFFGSRPFSQVNEWLLQNGKTPVEWQLPATPPEINRK